MEPMTIIGAKMGQTEGGKMRNFVLDFLRYDLFRLQSY